MNDGIANARVLVQALAQLQVGVWIGSARGVEPHRAGETLHMNARFGELLHVSHENAWCPALLAASGAPLEEGDLPFERARRTGTPALFEDVGVRVSGGARSHLRVRAVPLLDEAGGLSHIVVTAVDIATELRARAESTQIANRLSLAVRHAPVAFWSVDQDGVVTMSEGDLLRKLGVAPGELVGKSLFDVYRQHPTIPGDIRRALAGESVAYTTEVGDVLLESWLAPLPTVSGEAAGAIGVSTDITERVRMQGKLIETDRGLALGTLAASVAHEINNPLTYTMIALNQVRAAVARLAGAVSDEERAECLAQAMAPLEVASDGLRSIQTVTQDLRSFTRMDAGACMIDVHAIAKSALRLVANELEGQVRVVVELSDVPLVFASESRLIQVFVNLLLNAAQALSDQTHERVVTLSTRTVDGAAIVTVSDNGPGVPQGMREHIFEAFVTTKPVGVGTGLGLFVCRNIVRGLGGEITVGDRRGGGAEFQIRIPAGSGLLPAAVGRTPALPRPHGARILIVDDDARVGAALRETLRCAGHSVTVVDNTADAIALLVAEPRFDLCFCDLMMHGVASTDVFVAVAARAPGREDDLVYMTGGAYSAVARRFFAERPDRAVEKPFDIVGETAKRLTAR